MKKQVKFSTWSTMLSASAIIVLLYVLKYTKDDMPYWCIAIGLMLIVSWLSRCVTAGNICLDVTMQVKWFRR